MGEKEVMVGVGDDMGEGMQCADHPFRNNPGGICAFCLQEKLGKLVISSKSNPFLPIPPPSSSSSPPSSSFRSSSDVVGGSAVGGGGTTSGGSGRGRTKIPFLSAAAASHHHHKKKKKKGGSQSDYNSSGRKVMASSSTTTSSSSSSSANNSSALVLKRSKSVAPRPLGGLAEVGSIAEATTDSPRKKSFWSFLYLSSSAAAAATSKRSTSYASGDDAWGSVGRDLKQRQQPVDDKRGEEEEEEEEGRRAYEVKEGQASSSFGRKVSRSRSVGCGSRSFSGDFLERISSGFGDCTLRRVESQREAKPKTVLHDDDDDDDDEQQRVKCGGLFGMISSSSSSSSYWLSDLDSAGRMSTSAVAVSSAARCGVTPHGGRSRNWGWASFASPMRAFRPTSSSKPSAPTTTTTVKTLNGVGASGNSSGKIGSNPSLLAVGS